MHITYKVNVLEKRDLIQGSRELKGLFKKVHNCEIDIYSLSLYAYDIGYLSYNYIVKELKLFRSFESDNKLTKIPNCE